MSRRHHLAAIAVTALAVVGLSTAGCSSDEKSTPRVTFSSEMRSCAESGRWFTIGDFGAPGSGIPVRTVDSGASEQQGTATLSCSVKAEGGGFRVVGFAQLSGATGGSFSVNGLFTPAGDQTGISVSLTRSGSTYKQSDCVATYPYPEPNKTVAAGKVWATVTCPKAENESAPRTCQAVATFRFENCDQ